MEMYQNDSLSWKYHQKVAKFMDEVAGIQLPKQKKSLIETRLRKRQKALGRESLHDYIDYALARNSVESINFIDALTTNKTEFFREHNHYPIFQNFLKQCSKENVKIWSAGCSSGEEPYTLAMLADDLRIQYEICATDISKSVLEKASRAIYPHSDIVNIPLNLRQKYLLRRKLDNRDEIKISKSLRNKVKFGEFNLVTGDYKSLPIFDIVFCRNVMIYFNQQQRETIAKNFIERITPGGLLFIGHSESLKNVDNRLEPIAPTVYQITRG